MPVTGTGTAAGPCHGDSDGPRRRDSDALAGYDSESQASRTVTVTRDSPPGAAGARHLESES